jgi:1-phosphatidylinositol-4-phosphate 5-kinase
MEGIFIAWQMIVLISSVIPFGLMLFVFYKFPRTRAHPGPVLLCILLSSCLGNIFRVALNTIHARKLSISDKHHLISVTLSYAANHELEAEIDNLESYVPFFFWCSVFFITSATMWYLMLAMDLIFSLSNPFLPFNADNIKHHVLAWPAALIWCIIFRFAFESHDGQPSKHVLAYLRLPAYLVLIYIAGALIVAWRKSRRLEAHAHLTTRRMAKLILPYLVVFAVYTIVLFILYVFDLSSPFGSTNTCAALSQLANTLETLVVFVLFCCDAKVMQTLRGTLDKNCDGENPTMEQGDILDETEKIDVSNKLRMDIMKYTSMGIIQSTKQSMTAEDKSEVVFDDYNKVESMSIVIHGEIDSVVLSFRDFAPKVFHNLREHFNIDPQAYLESFDLNNILHEHGSEGKSGNIFYFTGE